MKNTIRNATILVTWMLILTTFPAYSESSKPAYVLEVIELMPGKSADDVLEYLERVDKVTSKYGATAKQVYAIPSAPQTPSSDKVALVWKIDDLTSLPGMFEDGSYQQHVAFRDSVLNLSTRTQYMGFKKK